MDKQSEYTFLDEPIRTGVLAACSNKLKFIAKSSKEPVEQILR